MAAHDPAHPLRPVRGLRAHRVATAEDLRAFVDLSAALAKHRGEDAHYVPLFASDIADWHRGTGWFAEAVELWLVRDGSGAAVGRLLCHSSTELAERIAASDSAGVADPTLFFGALEAADSEALERIIALIGERAHRHGATRVFGPVAPLPNVTGGVVTAGTEHPGFFDTVWNPAFFAPAFRAAGFSSWGPAQTWEVRIGDIPPARATAVTAAEWSRHRLRRRRISRFGVKRFAARLLPTLNASFSALPYYTQISPDQLRTQMAGLSALMDPSLIVDVVGEDEDDDVPSRCFALVVPDPIAVLRRHGGRLGPAALWALLRRRTRLRDAVLIIQGTDPRFQGKGLLSLVIRDVCAALAAGGYRRLRVTFIAEDNPASAAVFARAGGTPLHSLCFFDRRLGDRGDRDDRGVVGDSGVRGRSPGGESAVTRIDAEVLAALFAAAAHAPSAHNTQPWVPDGAGIAEDGSGAEVVVTVDPERTLPFGDPRSEDLHLSIGCWVEALSIAAAEAGLAASVLGVSGWGPSLEVRMRLVVEGASGDRDPGGGRRRPAFGIADLRHRQVDRGRLERDDAAVASALSALGDELAGSGAQLIEIPDKLWSPLRARASRQSLADPDIFAETLTWLRLNKRDPAYRQDGLTAECLRIPSPIAQMAGVLNRNRLRPLIARVGAAALAASLRPVTTPLSSSGPDEAAAASAGQETPHHFALTVDEPAPGPPVTEREAGREVEYGRTLLRTWLQCDRVGLRVDVHSEIKDFPDTRAALQEHLVRAGAARPVAVFSLGRSTTPVPRSPRL